MEETFPGGWEASVRGRLEGDPPYPVLVATDGPRVVGFAGPIRVEADGHGGFTGIGTHPEYRRHKIGTTLFHLLCAEFQRRGATYCILHTGLRNPAQEIYFGAGFKMMYLVDYSMVKRLA
jgi:ribosomal protein S18 acetylase RimI-like enzyme